MEKVIKLENVDQYNNLYGLETLHPLVSIVDLTKATKSVNHIQMNYGLYALLLKETKSSVPVRRQVSKLRKMKSVLPFTALFFIPT